MENTYVLVLNKRQYNAVEKYRKSKECQITKYSTDMKYPFYAHIGHKYKITAVGYEHWYLGKDAIFINHTQLLELVK